jgi:hypothetical protein
MKHSKEWSCIHKLPDSRKTTDSVKQQLETLQGLALCSWCCSITLQEKQHCECEHQLALQSGGAYDDDDEEDDGLSTSSYLYETLPGMHSIHKLPNGRKTTDSMQQLEKLQSLALCSRCCSITLQQKQHLSLSTSLHCNLEHINGS